MRISATYSHINGLEYLLVHNPEVWSELQAIVAAIDAQTCVGQVPPDRSSQESICFDAGELYRQFSELLKTYGWNKREIDYWNTRDVRLARQTVELQASEQKRVISLAGGTPIPAHLQSDFVKGRVATEVQFRKYSLVAYDLFVKHLAFYVGDQIDVGVEILPMKTLQSEMSSGVPYYEGELYNVVRQGRGVPSVPLIIVGIEP